MKQFEKAYELMKENLGCPKNCKICENNVAGPLFLPGEMEFLSKKFKFQKEKFPTVI